MSCLKFCTLVTSSSSIRKCLCAKVYQKTMSACYSRRGMRKEHLEELTTPDDRFGFNVAEDLEELTDFVENEFEQHNKVSKGMDKRQREWLKRKIIERKYFKKPQETNLLTWAAKEQIRYLHREFPEEWPVERLALSFPISREGVIKLLKSRFAPKNTEELLKHDRSVVENWKALKSGLDSDRRKSLSKGAAGGFYQQVLESGRLDSLGNADGIPDVVIPYSQKSLAEVSTTPPEKPGVFLSMLYDMKKEATREDVKVLMEKQKIDNKTALESVKSTVLKIKGPSKTSGTRTSSKQREFTPTHEAVPSSQPSKTHNHRKTDERALRNLQSVLDGDTDLIQERAPRLKSSQKQALIDADFGDINQSERSVTSLSPREESDQELAVSVRKSLRRMRGNPSQLSKHTSVASKSHNHGFEGTYKVDSTLQSSVSRSKKTYITKSLPTDDREVQGETFERELQIEHCDDGVDQPFVYSPETGYQYPLGRKEKIQEKINVPRRGQRSDLYQQGSSFYDSDGEFLFRVPE